MQVLRKFGVATGQAAYPTPLGSYEIMTKQAQPVVAPAGLRLGRGRRADPARSRQSARHALDGAFGAGRRNPRHARRRVDRLLRLARLHPHARAGGRVALRAGQRRHSGLHPRRRSGLGPDRGAARGSARRRRAAQAEHEDDLWEAAQDPEVWRWLPVHAAADRESFHRWFEDAARAARRRAGRPVRRRRPREREGDRQHPLPDASSRASRARDRLDVERAHRPGAAARTPRRSSSCSRMPSRRSAACGSSSRPMP